MRQDKKPKRLRRASTGRRRGDGGTAGLDGVPAEPRIFHDVVVTPTDSIIGRREEAEFQGGPLWPDFEAQVEARHCRGLKPTPFDTAPAMPDRVSETLREAIWCGPVCPHFGHAIADFATRITEAAHQMPGLPLLFTIWRDHGGQRPAFFDGILAQFGVPMERVLLLDVPARAARLHVLPQAERLNGPRPRRAYLDLLDRHTPSDRDPDLAEATIFVSRSKVHPKTLSGRLAGEAYLDEVFAAAGMRVIYPEELPLAEQLRIYRSARRLVFSEGSAVHALQLLGRISAQVVVLNRRTGSRMARNALAARVDDPLWLDAVAGLVRGLHRSGRGFDTSRGVAVLDAPVLLEQLGQATGLSLAPHWDTTRWDAAWRADVARWVAAREMAMQGGTHAAKDAEVVATCLEELGLGRVGQPG